jgi:hypothetical protein
MDSTTEILLRGLGDLLFSKSPNNTNRKKVKITKDGQSRSMRQTMAEGRRNRGESKNATTSQQRGNRIKSARSARAKGGPNTMTRGRGVSTRPATGNRGAQGPRTAPQQGPERAVRGLLGERPTTTRTPAPTRSPYNRGSQTQQNVNSLRSLGRNALKLFSRGGVIGSVFNQSTSNRDTPSTVGVRSRGDAERSIGKYNTMDPDGTIRNRLRVGEGRVGTYENQFDRAYAQAKGAGLDTFEFDGKLFAVR